MRDLFDPERRRDWPERLALAIREHRKGAFEWGQYDCATYFSDVVFAMTDADPFEALGTWRSATAALRILARTGAGSVKEYLDARLPSVSVAELRRGDAGFLAEFEPLTCPAIVIGAEALARAESGWIVFPISRLATGYRIGR